MQPASRPCRKLAPGWRADLRNDSLVRHCVEEDVESEWIVFLLREFAEKPGIRALLFPAIAIVRVVADHYHHAAFVVEDPAEMNVPCVTTFMVVFPSDARVPVARGEGHVRRLQRQIVRQIED